MSAHVARSHGGDGRGNGKLKPNLGGRATGRLNTRDKTQNLSLKEITDTNGPVPIQFELRDKQTVMPLGDHAAHWSSYIGEVIRVVPLYYPSWLKVPKERKVALIIDIGTQFDLRPHMESLDWTEINAEIQQHLQKAYNTNKAAFKAQHWRISDGYVLSTLQLASRITILSFGMIPGTLPEPLKIGKTGKRARSYLDRDPGRLLAFEMRWQTSTTLEYPSLIDTFFVAHTINEEFLWDEDRQEVSSDGTFPVWVEYCQYWPQPAQFESGGASESSGCEDEEEGADHQDDKDEDGDGDT
nr:hypothetical protein [Tanacetum cinerariifolium]